MSLRAHVDVHSRRKRSRLFLLFALTTLGMVSRPSTSDAAQLTLTWVDNSGGESAFSIERKTGTAGTYAEIGQQSAGVVSYVDTTVSGGTTLLLPGPRVRQRRDIRVLQRGMCQPRRIVHRHGREGRHRDWNRDEHPDRHHLRRRLFGTLREWHPGHAVRDARDGLDVLGMERRRV